MTMVLPLRKRTCSPADGQVTVGSVQGFLHQVQCFLRHDKAGRGLRNEIPLDQPDKTVTIGSHNTAFLGSQLKNKPPS